TLRAQKEPEECDQVAKQCDYRFDTIHDGQCLATSLTAARFKGNSILKNQRDSIIADDTSEVH
ncbi:MAG: hypothetical protein ABFS22_13285, partial [Pseudomonadota bacterium]